MLIDDPILIDGPLGRTFRFTRRYQGRNLFGAGALAFHHDRTYAKQTLLDLTAYQKYDPFNYRLLDVWQLVCQKPWTQPRNVHELVNDLAEKIHRGELFVYREQDDLAEASLFSHEAAEGPAVALSTAVSRAETPRTNTSFVVSSPGTGESRDAPAITSEHSRAPQSNLDRASLYHTVGLDTVTGRPGGGETMGAMYDKVYD